MSPNSGLTKLTRKVKPMNRYESAGKVVVSNLGKLDTSTAFHLQQVTQSLLSLAQPEITLLSVQDFQIYRMAGDSAELLFTIVYMFATWVPQEVRETFRFGDLEFAITVHAPVSVAA